MQIPVPIDSLLTLFLVRPVSILPLIHIYRVRKVIKI